MPSLYQFIRRKLLALGFLLTESSKKYKSLKSTKICLFKTSNLSWLKTMWSAKQHRTGKYSWKSFTNSTNPTTQIKSVASFSKDSSFQLWMNLLILPRKMVWGWCMLVLPILGVPVISTRWFKFWMQLISLGTLLLKFK